MSLNLDRVRRAEAYLEEKGSKDFFPGTFLRPQFLGGFSHEELKAAAQRSSEKWSLEVKRDDARQREIEERTRKRNQELIQGVTTKPHLMDSLAATMERGQDTSRPDLGRRAIENLLRERGLEFGENAPPHCSGQEVAREIEKPVHDRVRERNFPGIVFINGWPHDLSYLRGSVDPVITPIRPGLAFDLQPREKVQRTRPEQGTRRDIKTNIIIEMQKDPDGVFRPMDLR